MTAEKVQMWIDGEHFVFEGTEQVDELMRIGREAPTRDAAWRRAKQYGREVSDK